MARRRLAQHLAEALKAHAEIEAALLYPFVRNVSGEASRWVHQARVVHRSIDGMLDEILESDVSAERLGGLRNLVMRCLEDEEACIFPLLHALDDASAGELRRCLDAYQRDVAAGTAD